MEFEYSSKLANISLTKTLKETAGLELFAKYLNS
jgi:hypothetical protein